MTVFQEFVERARQKVNPSDLTYRAVAERLNEANGFKRILDVGNTMLIVNPRFDSKNPVEPGTAEWIIQWHQWTGDFLTAPDTFFIWWNDPADLQYLVDAGHYTAHKEKLRQDDLEVQRVQAKSFADRFLRR